MKCKACGGTGWDVVRGIDCISCDGKGEITLTNEEWLRQAATEQLAEKLTDFSFWLVFTIPTEDKRKKVRKRIVEWLKQPHTVKE